MDAGQRSPTHDKDTGSEKDGFDHRGYQTGFWNHLTIVSYHTLAVVGLPPKVDGRCEEYLDYNGEKRDRSDDFVPATLLLKFNGK